MDEIAPPTPGSTCLSPFAIRTAIILSITLRLVFLFDLFPAALSTLVRNPAVISALSDPRHGLRHLREGVALTQLNGADGRIPGIYDLGETSFKLPPLVLAALEPVLSRPFFSTSEESQALFMGVLMFFVDIGVAVCLFRIGSLVARAKIPGSKQEAELECKMNMRIRARRKWVFGLQEEVVTNMKNKSEGESSLIIQADTSQQSRAKDDLISVATIHDMPVIAALAYYCNPISILASCAHGILSIQSVWALLVLMAIHEAAKCGYGAWKNQQGIPDASSSGAGVSLAAFFLAVATYVEVYPVVYLIPMSILSQRHATACVAYFFSWVAVLTLLSAILLGETWREALLQVYKMVIGFEVLGPNIGMAWYLFLQTFTRFQQYFTLLISCLPFVFVVPLSLRLKKNPIALATAFMFVWTLFKPSGTLYDASIALSMMLVSPRTIARMGNGSIVAFVAITIPIALYAIDYWLWLESGTGNANYIFFMCLAYNSFLGVIFLDFVGATVKRDKALRLTNKAERTIT